MSFSMDGFEGGSSIGESSNRQGLSPAGANPTDAPLFDASQYAFFGNDALEEVELGGLGDEEDDLPSAELDEEYQFEREEEVTEPLSEIDELVVSFSELNKADEGRTTAQYFGNSVSRESSSAVGFRHETELPRWFDQHPPNVEYMQDNIKWSSHPYSSGSINQESKPLHRTASYPEQQQQYQQDHPQQHYSSEPILIPKSSFNSFPPPGAIEQPSPENRPHHPNISYNLAGHHMLPSPPSFSPFSNPQVQLNALPRGQFGASMPQFRNSSRPINSQQQNQWMNRTNIHPGDRPFIPSDMLQQQSPHNNGLIPSQMMSQQQPQQHMLNRTLRSSFGNLPGLPPQAFNHHLPPSPPMMNNFDLLGLSDLRDQRTKLLPRQGMRHPQMNFDTSSHHSFSGWPRFKTKYMTSHEIENILRIQLAAMHSNDPYVDDYYHQACLSKKSVGAKVEHHFCPTNLRDGSSRARADSEPHPFLQVDALGRVSFSSIRRPRPLLEVDPPNSSHASGTEQKKFEKPLEQEPMLAARVTIEDGISLLLDVDDIDRILQFNSMLDGGLELRHRREVLLEGLSTSLHLVDPLGKNGQTVNLTAKDDLVFLRLVSLPKGRKLVSRYLQRLFPDSELTRVVCMAIFRHLRFLFGGLPADPGAAETVINLGRTVSDSVKGMELKALAACLASAVCSTEHPPLRPIGSPAGDGASVILKSVLERATELLIDPHASPSCSMSSRAFWQGSFDSFFGLLIKYCFNKYDTIIQPLVSQASLNLGVNGSDAAKAISRELPVELLRASLPHTNEQQKKTLLDFAQRSMPILGVNSQGGNK